MSIDVTEIVSQFGDFYKPGSDNERNLRDMLYKPSGLATFFNEIPGEDTQYRGTMAHLTRVVQSFQKGFTGTGTLAFKPNKFDLFQMKIDLPVSPDDIAKTYVGFLRSDKTLNRADWPLVRYMIENHILPRKDQDMIEEYFHGVFVEPTPGTPGNAGESMDGLRKVLRGYATANRLNFGNGPIATGAAAADAADFCEQTEEFVNQMAPHLRRRVDILFMSDSNARKFARGKSKKYGLQVNFLNGNGVQDRFVIEDQPNIRVVGVEEMEGSDMMFATTPLNRIRPTKAAALGKTMKVEEAKREVFVMSDWWEALNFEVPEFVVTNDQDLS